MVSDVPISIASSGGLDSSILQLIAKKFNSRIKLISWDFKDKKYSEKKFTLRMGKITKLDSDIFRVTPDHVTKYLEKIVRVNEEPFSGLPILAYYLCIKYVSNTKVILDGSGLDEAHTGYKKYFKNISMKKNFLVAQDGSKSNFQSIIHENFAKNFDEYRNFKNSFKMPFKSSFEKARFADLFFLKLPRALRQRDKISMSLGKEIRPCFLDRKLISALYKVKKSEQFNSSNGKLFLRNLYKNEISRKIAFAKKRNVQTPQTVWFKKDLELWLDDYLNNLTLWENNWINKKNIFKNYKLFKNGKINNSFFIWKIINLELWNNNF